MSDQKTETVGFEGGVCGPAPREECPDCGNLYATVQRLKKHVVLHHAMRSDQATRQFVSFRSMEDLEHSHRHRLEGRSDPQDNDVGRGGIWRLPWTGGHLNHSLAVVEVRGPGIRHPDPRSSLALSMADPSLGLRQLLQP